MDKYTDLGVSVFDEDFVLDPFPYLKDLYAREDVLGFRADGMQFVFRFDQAKQIVRSRRCRREPVANPEIEARERVWAERYPNRARHFGLAYASAREGLPDFTIKKLMMEHLDWTAEHADFSGARPIYARLGGGGRLDDYVASVQTLPLRMMLDSSGLAYTEDELLALNQAGVDFIRALDNFVDESPLPAAEAALDVVWRYLEEQFETAPADAPMQALVERARAQGVDDERILVNFGGFLLIPLANTAGIASAFLLRNLIRYPAVREALRNQPGLVADDHVMTELLRRDSHVKALSRQVHEEFALDGFTLERGESVFLFFPGVNLDPAEFPDPLSIDLSRRFDGSNNLVFGGSAYICIGKKLGLEFMKNMAAGFLEYLPDRARVVEDEIEVDGHWVAERIITKMPIALDG
jgi:hypothetical protein